MNVIHQASQSLKPLQKHGLALSRRALSSSSLLWQKPAAAASAVPVSSVKAGTLLKGLGIIKGLGDPIAKADEEYPSWLWTLIEPGMGAGKSDEPLRAIRRELNKENRNKISLRSTLIGFPAGCMHLFWDNVEIPESHSVEDQAHLVNSHQQRVLGSGVVNSSRFLPGGPMSPL